MPLSCMRSGIRWPPDGVILPETMLDRRSNGYARPPQGCGTAAGGNLGRLKTRPCVAGCPAPHAAPAPATIHTCSMLWNSPTFPRVSARLSQHHPQTWRQSLYVMHSSRRQNGARKGGGATCRAAMRVSMRRRKVSSRCIRKRLVPCAAQTLVRTRSLERSPRTPPHTRQEIIAENNTRASSMIAPGKAAVDSLEAVSSGQVGERQEWESVGECPVLTLSRRHEVNQVQGSKCSVCA